MINLVDSFELLSVSKFSPKDRDQYNNYKCLLNADDLLELLSSVKKRIISISVDEGADVGMHMYGGSYTYTAFLEFLEKHGMDIYDPDTTSVYFNDGITMYIKTGSPFDYHKITIHSLSTDFDIAKYFRENNEVDGQGDVEIASVVCNEKDIHSNSKGKVWNYCPFCGERINEWKFCPFCGNALSNSNEFVESDIPQQRKKPISSILHAKKNCEADAPQSADDVIPRGGCKNCKYFSDEPKKPIDCNKWGHCPNKEELYRLQTEKRECAIRRDKEERWEKDEPKRVEFIQQMSSFLAKHGTDEVDPNALLWYAIRKLNSGFNFGHAEWHSNQDCIKFHDHWAGGSFFDDGGGETGFRDWSFTYIGIEEAGLLIENEKLKDLSEYEVSSYRSPVNDSFFVKDPFGLRGIFEVRFYGEEEHID